MDSVLSMDTNTNAFPHSPPLPEPDISSTLPTPHSQPSILVPKSEPFWDADDLSAELDLLSEFNRVSELFHFAFGATHVDFQPPNVSCPDPDADAMVPPNPSEVNSVPADPNAGSADDLRAIVPVPAAGTVAVAVARRGKSRKKELVRVSNMSARDEAQFREIVRRTRLLYDSLRVLTAVEEEKRAAAAAETLEGGGRARRLRGDARAAALMRQRGLWLNRDKRIVGPIPGIFVGDLFLFRMELCVVGLHGQVQAGIDYLPGNMSATGEPIATSVIVSGGYEDDADDGEVIVYTGHGGQGKNSSKQVADQRLVSGNLALERSRHYGVEVRVIRGIRYEGGVSGSGKVYVYDGVYKIVDHWFEFGKSGFRVYKFRLCRIPGQAKMGSAVLKEARNIRRSGLDFNHVFCLAADMSNRKENVPVRLFNDIDDDRGPLCYEYLSRTSFPQFVFHQSGKATGCDCVDGCGDGCFCAMKNGGEFPYTLQGHLVRGKPLIFECGPFCSCPPHCRNRVAQKGLKNRLEVFRSQQTAWGVRSLDLILAGAFICEFAGVVLTRQQAQLLTMNGDSLIYPNRFSERWAEWGDLSQIYPQYARPSYPSIPPLDFSLDVSTMRNAACYMSHSSTPNVLVQFVLYDHNNLMFPHVMLFPMENIPPMRELSLDYGVADEWTGKLSICN
ncbi:histone-lysine N-methyltransferase family member SUVH9 [Cajanus cajan]|uniref:histone-lysine N-methyltransferase family member SUVH9 n=1 Tax=Cajanus cajan TaxID=3821 RepID=UPI00098DB41C|nr:histone-lysine N-methyltransferase family member SUVH9 [Cajanus cajan]XP_020229978.1 histone-lysine N-methyltransferase family member SUVH9 [Cajanus cajan]